MEREAAGKKRRGFAVEVVPENGTAERGEVDTDLMRAPGFQAEMQVRAAVPNFQYFIMRDGGFTIWRNEPPNAYWFLIDGKIDHSAFLGRCADADRVIFPLKGGGVEQRLHSLLGVGVPRDEQ